MSATVDSRVLEMRFDNKEFEANAKETINTLNTLKRALEENVNGEAFENLDRAAKNVDLSSIERSLDAITDRFSTMGVVGMRVIQNLTDALMNMVSNGINKVFDAISTGGAKRARDVETARFQLQGLIDDQKEVEAIMDDAKQSVSDTAYAYNDAAKAASMFAATGLRSGEEMQRSLKAIAGVAATTSSDYESMAQIFTTIAGQGRVMSDQLNQLATRGLNAAATLKDYFNGVKDGSITANKSVQDLVKSLAGMSDEGYLDSAGSAFSTFDDAYKSSQKAFQQQYKERQKALNNEYNAVKKTLDSEYKNIKNTLDAEYNAKKKTYDEEYKALDNALSEEISALQKANSQRLKEANEAYTDQVEAYRKATEERISLINEEYTESIKLIDEERYNKLKAIDDELKAMEELEEKESRQRINEANAERKAAIEDLAAKARSKRAKIEAAEAVADVNKAIADQEESWRKQDRKKELSEQKDQINEDANLKRQEALSKRDQAVSVVQEESQAKLKEMQKTHEIEMEQLQEQLQAEVTAKQESRQAQLTALRESQSEELSQYRESQTLQLEAVRERQQSELEAIRERNQEELEALKELNNDKLSEMKSASKTGVKALKDFDEELGFTEANIRDMVSDGMISFDLFAEAMASTFGDHAKDANKTFDGAMANIRAALARTGEMFYKPFYQQEGPMVRLFNSIRIKINELNEALTPFANTLTTNILHIIPDIQAWVDRLDFSFRYLREDSNGAALSFSKFKAIGITLSNVMLGLKNIFEAIGSYIRPVIQAFGEVFMLDYDRIQDASFSFRNLTESLKASEETAAIIHDIFYGFFNVIRSGISIVSNFIRKLKPLSSLLELVGSAAAFIGNSILDAVLAFTEWVTTSESVAKAIENISNWIDKFINNLRTLKQIISESFKDSYGGFSLGKYFSQGFLEGIKSFGKDILDFVTKFFSGIIDRIKEIYGIHSPSEIMYQIGVWLIEGFKIGIQFMMNDVIPFVIEVFLGLIEGIKSVILSVDWADVMKSAGDTVVRWINSTSTAIAEGIPKVIDKVGEFLRSISEYGENYEFNDGEGSVGWKFILAIITAMGNAIEALGAGLYMIAKSIWDSLVKFFREFSLQDAIRIAKEFITEFATALITRLSEWKNAVSTALKNFFGDIDSASLLALATGIGLMWMFIKVCQALFKLTNPLDTFTLTLNAFKNALLGMSYDLKANALLKVSLSIALITAVIVALYEVFKHMEPGDIGKFALATVVVGAAVFAVSYIAVEIIGLYNNLNTINGALGNIGLALKKMATALEVRVIVSSIISTISNIIFDIAVLATIYRSDKDAFWASIGAMGIIAAGLAVLMSIAAVISNILAEKTDFQGFKNVTGSVLAFSASVLLIILAIKEITKLEFSWDDVPKLVILAGIIAAVIAVISIVSKSEIKENTGSLTLKIGTMIAFGVLMLIVISTFKKLVKEGIGLFGSLNQIAMLAVLLALVTTVCYFLAKAGRASVGVTKYGSAVIGIAFVLLASLYALKKLQDFEWEAYWLSLAKLVGVFVAMAFVCYAASYVYSNDGYKDIIAVGALIAALMVVLTVLTKLDQDKLLTSAVALGITLVALGAALYGAGQLSQANLATFGSLLVMLVAIVGIGAILAMIAANPWEQIAAAGISFSIVILAFTKAFRRIQEITTEVKWKTIGQFLTFTLSLIPISAALAFVSTAGKWNSILAAGTAISEIIIAYGVVFKNMQGVRVDWKTIGQFILGSIGLIPIVAIMGILALTSNWSSLLAAGTAMAEIIGAYGYVFVQLNKAKEVKINTIGNFLLGTVSLIVIANAIKIAMGKNNQWYNMLSASTAISEVIVAYGYVFRKLDGISVDKDQVKEFLRGTISIIIIGGTIGALAYFCNWNDLIISATAISEVLAAYAIVFTHLQGVKVSNEDMLNFLKGTLAIAAIGAILGLVLGISDATGHPVQWDQMLSTATAISEVLDACAIAAKIISSINGDFNWAGAKYLLAGLVAAVGAAAILAAFTDEHGDPANTLATATGIAAIMIAVGVLAAIVGEVGKIAVAVGAKELLIADGVILAIIGGLGLVAEGIAGIALAFGENNAETAKKNMILIGEGFGGFFGALFESFLKYAGKGIAGLGTDLSKFMENSAGFFEGIANLDDSLIAKTIIFTDIIKTLVVSEFVDSIAGIVNALNPFKEDMSTRFANMGKAIKGFADAVGDTGGWNTKNFAEAVNQLVKAYTSLNPLVDFIRSLELPTLGENFKLLGQSIADIFGSNGLDPNDFDPEAYANFASCVESLYGILKDFTLDQVSEISFKITSVGDSLKQFSGSLRTIIHYAKDFSDLTPFQNLVKIAEMLFPWATTERIISPNNFISEFVGTNDPASFGYKLLTFCKFLVGDSEAAAQGAPGIWDVIKNADIDVNKFQLVSDCAQKMLEIAERIPTENAGWKEFWEGDNSLHNFATEYLTFVKSVVNIRDEINKADIDPKDFNPFVLASKKLLSIIGVLKDYMVLENNTVVDLPSHLYRVGESFTQFGGSMVEFSTAAVSSYEGFNQANEMLGKFVELMPDLLKFDGGSNITDFFQKLKDTAASGLRLFLDAFRESETPVQQAIAVMFGFISTAITSKKDMMEGFGRIVVTNYFAGDNGMRSEEAKQSVIDAMENLLYVATNNLNLQSFYNAGKNAVYGFADGLSDSRAMRDVKTNAHNMAVEAYNEAMYALDENSPSRKMMQVGEYAGEGFAIGLENWISAAGKAGYDVGDTALESLRNVLSNVSSEIQNEDEFNPTITPVLDLSNIEENATRIGGILDVNTPLQLAANAGMSFNGGLNGMLTNIQASMPEFTDTAIVDAINEMRYDISRMSDAIRQMQIVMDTGELVGAITQPIDDQLGFNSMLNKRGVR